MIKKKKKLDKEKAYFTKCSILLLESLYTCFLSHLTALYDNKAEDVPGNSFTLLTATPNRRNIL